MSKRSVEYWEKKLEHLRTEEAIATDPGQKFQLPLMIDEAKVKIAELKKENARSRQVRFPDYDARIQRFVDEYVGTAEQPVPFGGRDAELQYLDSWLVDKTQPQRLFIGAPAGRGKSALLAHWSRSVEARWTDIHVVFFPVSIRFRTNLASVVFPAIAARLAVLHGEDLPATVSTPPEVWRAIVSSYLTRSLPGEERLLLVLDGVDEAADWDVGPDICPYELPASTRFVVSARYLAGHLDGSSWFTNLGWTSQTAIDFSLKPLSHEGVSDVLHDVKFPAHILARRNDVVAELHRLSEGDPLLVRLYVEYLWSRGDEAMRLQPEDLREIEPGLGGYFSRWWEDQRNLWGENTPLREPLVQGLLNIFSCALGPLYQDDLLRLCPPSLGANVWTLPEAMRPLQRFVIGDGKEEGYALTHPRLSNFFYEQLKVDGEAPEQELLFVEWGRRTLTAEISDPDQFSPYLVQYYRIHLDRTKGGLDDLKHLISKDWLSAWSRIDRGSYVGFMTDVNHVWFAARAENERMVRSKLDAADLALEVRCALSRSSISSLAGKVPILVVTGLIEKEVWSIQQLLSYCTQILDVRQRLRTLIAVGDVTAKQNRRMVLASVLSIVGGAEDEREKVDLVTSLSGEYLPNYVCDALLDEFRSVDDAAKRTRLLLKASISYIGENKHTRLVDEALAACREIDSPTIRASLLLDSITYLDGHPQRRTLAQLLSDICKIKDDWQRHEMLHNISGYLSIPLEETEYDVVTSSARSIEDESKRDYALNVIKTYSPTRVLPPRDNNVNSTPSVDQAGMTLSQSSEHNHIDAVFDEALRILEDASAESRPTAFAALLGITATIADPHSRGQRLLALAPHTPSALLPEFLLQLDCEVGQKAPFVAVIASTFPKSLLAESIHAVEALRNPNTRVELLVEIARTSSGKRLPAMRRALSSIREIQSRVRVERTLESVIPLVPATLFPELFELVSMLSPSQASHVLRLVPPHLRAYALDSAKKIDSIPHRFALIGEFASSDQDLQCPLHDLLTLARVHPSEGAILRILEMGTWNLTDDARAIEVARSLRNHELRARALFAISLKSRHDNRGALIGEALSSAYEMADATDRAKFCFELALLVDGKLKKEAREAAMKATETIMTSGPVSEGVRRLRESSDLPLPLRVACLFKWLLTGDSADSSLRVESALFVASMFPSHPSKHIIDFALELASQINDAPTRLQLLLYVADSFPNLLEINSHHTLEESQESGRPWMLAPEEDDDLVDHLKEAIESAVQPDHIIRSLAKHRHFALVLSATEKLPDRQAVYVLFQFATASPVECQHSPLLEAFFRWKTGALHKDSPITGMLELFFGLPNPSLTLQREALHAITEVADEQETFYMQRLASVADAPLIENILLAMWNREKPLDGARIFHELEQHHSIESLILTALQTVSNLPEKEQTHALTALAPQLGRSEIGTAEALRMAGNMANRSLRATTLVSLAGHVSSEQNQSVLIDAFRAVENMSISATIAHRLLDPVRSLMRPEEELLSRALDAAMSISNELSREEEVNKLAPMLDAVLLEKAAAGFGVVGDFSYRAQTICALSALTDENQRLSKLSQALVLARKTTNLQARSIALSQVASGLPYEQQQLIYQEAISESEKVASRHQRAALLLAITRHMVDGDELVLIKLLDALSELQDYLPGRALVLLAPHIPCSLFKRLLRLAVDRSDADHARIILLIVAPRLSEELLQKALELFKKQGIRLVDVETARLYSDRFCGALLQSALERAVRDRDIRELLLLAECCPNSEKNNVLQKTFEIIKTEDNLNLRALALEQLIPLLSQNQRSHAIEDLLNTIANIDQDWQRAMALKSAATWLTPNNLQAVWNLLYTFPDEAQRASVTASLAPIFPDSLLPNALDSVRQISSVADRADALRRLALRASNAERESLISEALNTIREIKEESERSTALIQFGADVGDEVLTDTLKATAELSKEEHRIYVVSRLARNAPDAVFEQILLLVKTLRNEHLCATLLGQLAGFIPSSMINDAFVILRSFSKSSLRAQALEALAPHLSEKLIRESIKIVRDFSRPTDRAETIARMAPFLPPEVRYTSMDQALCDTERVLDEELRGELLERMSRYLPEKLSDRATSTLNGIACDFIRTRVIRSMMTVAEMKPTKLLDPVRQIDDANNRAVLLAELAELFDDPCDQDEIVREALRIVASIDNKWGRSDALQEIALRMTKPNAAVVEESLRAVFRVPSDSYRATALERLSSVLPETIAGDAIKAACSISSEAERTRALAAICEHLPDSFMGDMVNAANCLTSERLRSEILLRVVPLLPGQLQLEVLDASRSFKSPTYRADILVALVICLPENKGTVALKELLSIEQETVRVYALRVLLPEIDDPYLSITLDALANITVEGTRSSLLLRRQIWPAPALERAFAVAQEIDDRSCRLRAIVGLARHLPPEEREYTIRNALDVPINSRFDATNIEVSSSNFEQILRSGLSSQTEDREEKLSAPADRELLALLYVEEADDGRSIDYRDARTRSHTMEVTSRLKHASCLEAECDRASALQRIAPDLNESHLQLALDIISGLRRENCRADAICAITPHLSFGHLSDAIQATRLIGNNERRSKVFEQFMSRVMIMERFNAYSLVTDTLQIYAKRHRSDLLTVLTNLSPAIQWLGGSEAVEESISAIIDSGTWWP